jgi:aspartyl-tRNA(Asn)/glutamyl-tRNA(Gln) amidotransferase subunit A
LVGLKPTYGSVSRSGTIAMGNSLDQIAPFGKTTRDAEILFNAIKGKDEMDAMSVVYPEIENANKKTIGIPWHLFEEGVDKEVMDNFKEGIINSKTLKDAQNRYFKYRRWYFRFFYAISRI